MYFRNGNVEVNTGISLLAESGKFDVIDSATPTNVVFKRGDVNFFTLDGTKNIIDVSTGRALSSQYIYGDYFIHRNVGADMVFQGSNTTDDGSVEYIMKLRTTPLRTTPLRSWKIISLLLRFAFSLLPVTTYVSIKKSALGSWTLLTCY